MEITFGVSNFDRERGNFPRLPVVNMFAEEAPTEGRISLQSRPGLENSSVSMGAGPVRALFRIDGVLDNRLFGVSGGNLYSSSTALGMIDGIGPASIDGYESFVFATAGEGLWGYNGTVFDAVAVPDSADTIKVLVGASRVVIIRKDTQTFYWSDPLTDTIDGLSFASAENSPDRLRDMLYLNDTLVLFGSKTVEFWPSTDDDDAPFQPLKGRVFQRGIKATGCATIFGSTFAWVTENNQICIGTPDAVVSDLGLSRRLEDSQDVTLWRFWLDSIEFLAVTHDAGTEVFSQTTKTWSEFASYGENLWLAKYYADGYFGSVETGQLYQWTDDYSDFDGVLERNFRAWAAIDSSGVTVNNVLLRMNPGHTPFLTGDYDNPVVEMRMSKDGGQTWGNWKSRTLGAQGKYAIQVKWNSLGMFSFPGALADFRVTDPVPFRVSNVLANEPHGGISAV